MRGSRLGPVHRSEGCASRRAPSSAGLGWGPPCRWRAPATRPEHIHDALTESPARGRHPGRRAPALRGNLAVARGGRNFRHDRDCPLGHMRQSRHWSATSGTTRLSGPATPWARAPLFPVAVQGCGLARGDRSRGHGCPCHRSRRGQDDAREPVAVSTRTTLAGSSGTWKGSRTRVRPPKPCGDRLGRARARSRNAAHTGRPTLSPSPQLSPWPRSPDTPRPVTRASQWAAHKPSEPDAAE